MQNIDTLIVGPFPLRVKKKKTAKAANVSAIPKCERGVMAPNKIERCDFMFRFRVRHLDFLGDLIWESYFRDLESVFMLISDRSEVDFCEGDSFVIEVVL